MSIDNVLSLGAVMDTIVCLVKSLVYFPILIGTLCVEVEVISHLILFLFEGVWIALILDGVLAVTGSFVMLGVLVVSPHFLDNGRKVQSAL